eukprot:1158274-Pelagomonas_calceolata.AAC.32
MRTHLRPGQGVDDDRFAAPSLAHDHCCVAGHHDLIQLDHFVHLHVMQNGAAQAAGSSEGSREQQIKANIAAEAEVA